MRRILAIVSIDAGRNLSGMAAQQAARAEDPPTFQPEPFWPKPLPENWILGQVAGIAVGPDDHIWIIHRPATLLDDEKAREKPARIQMLQGRARRHGVRHRRQPAAPLGRARRRQRG